MKNLRKNIVASLATILICGLAFPLLLTGIAQVVFPSQANGSMVTVAGQYVGSSLLGQAFEGPEYFHGRPSAINYNMNGTNQASGSNNMGPSDPALKARVEATIQVLLNENPGITRADIPLDMVTESASGLDPHISYQGALMQLDRVALENGLEPTTVTRLIDENKDRDNNVNVLNLNIALQKERS
ncbi:potassium-transporting ATPase subunit KdpC [Erysipelothrix sp. HDW6C]|uniref:potassium-transporting ATPase subunit KdpC n=1 Tax=Erysipelothrix sp. HDW6C TaxID=2714930 RepID=UPI00140C7194|nr:potassium-transporting ATPase subunit KdpC [Erysipelothrix sp. HDW6C]QIK70788.1 potassium-transporting ATPase subunit KdpC [Erysipelothrix sp. HDW6C]